jgi:hypothetical protein
LCPQSCRYSLLCDIVLSWNSENSPASSKPIKHTKKIPLSSQDIYFLFLLPPNHNASQTPSKRPSPAAFSLKTPELHLLSEEFINRELSGVYIRGSFLDYHLARGLIGYLKHNRRHQQRPLGAQRNASACQCPCVTLQGFNFSSLANERHGRGKILMSCVLLPYL